MVVRIHSTAYLFYKARFYWGFERFQQDTYPAKWIEVDGMGQPGTFGGAYWQQTVNRNYPALQAAPPPTPIHRTHWRFLRTLGNCRASATGPRRMEIFPFSIKRASTGSKFLSSTVSWGVAFIFNLVCVRMGWILHQSRNQGYNSGVKSSFEETLLSAWWRAFVRWRGRKTSRLSRTRT